MLADGTAGLATSATAFAAIEVGWLLIVITADICEQMLAPALHAVQPVAALTHCFLLIGCYLYVGLLPVQFVPVSILI